MISFCYSVTSEAERSTTKPHVFPSVGLFLVVRGIRGVATLKNSRVRLYAHEERTAPWRIRRVLLLKRREPRAPLNRLSAGA